MLLTANGLSPQHRVSRLFMHLPPHTSFSPLAPSQQRLKKQGPYDVCSMYVTQALLPVLQIVGPFVQAKLDCCCEGMQHDSFAAKE